MDKHIYDEGSSIFKMKEESDITTQYIAVDMARLPEWHIYLSSAVGVLQSVNKGLHSLSCSARTTPEILLQMTSMLLGLKDAVDKIKSGMDLCMSSTKPDKE